MICQQHTVCHCFEAASEIERLRNELKSVRELSELRLEGETRLRRLLAEARGE